MEVFFIRYRKILLVGSIFMFVNFFYEIYKGIADINSSDRGEGTGTLIDACITLFVSIYLFINVRKAYKKHKEEIFAINQKAE